MEYEIDIDVWRPDTETGEPVMVYRINRSGEPDEFLTKLDGVVSEMLDAAALDEKETQAACDHSYETLDEDTHICTTCGHRIYRVESKEIQ